MHIHEYQKRLAQAIAINYATPRMTNKLRLHGIINEDAKSMIEFCENAFISTGGISAVSTCGFDYHPPRKVKNLHLSAYL